MKKIVVVEDQPVLASVYRAKFAAEGFQVDVATDGEAALETIQRVKPDLVLLDLMIPKIKGVDVLKRLRAEASFKTLPILVFSNSAQPGTVEEAWAAGASMVLSKSRTSPKQLVESVIETLANSAPSEERAIDETKPGEAKVFKDGSRKERILLTEINPEVRATLSLVLSRRGFQTIDADGCAHALMLSEVTHFDLAMVNSRLCFESAAIFCRQLRRRHANMPVVIYSMKATPEAVKQVLNEGASRFITTAEELFDAGEIATAMIDANRKGT